MFVIILHENQNQFRLGSIFGKKSSMHNVVILIKSIFNNKHNLSASVARKIFFLID